MLFFNVLIEQREKRNLQRVNIIRNTITIYSNRYRLYYCVTFLCIFLTIYNIYKKNKLFLITILKVKGKKKEVYNIKEVNFL